jgi:hypothetical protein
MQLLEKVEQRLLTDECSTSGERAPRQQQELQPPEQNGWNHMCIHVHLNNSTID